MQKLKILITGLLVFFCFTQFNLFAQNADTITVNQDSVYKNPEVKAMHPQGEAFMRTFLERRVNPATPVNYNAPEGTYTVEINIFTDTAGKITAVPKTNYGYGMEREVMRVVKKFPDFIPARQNGVPVKSVQTLPMVFVVMKTR